MLDMSVPLAGIRRAEASLNGTASRLATVGTPQGDAVDLSSEVVTMLGAKIAVQANANVIRSEAALSKSLIDLLG